jgi:hypothetical protein
VLRAGPDSEAVTVSYSVAGAVNADDFLTPLTGTINLAAGVSESLFTLQVKGDAVREGDEAFNVTFSHPAITGGTTVLAGTIRDDDQGLQLTAPASIVEGDSGSTSATFQLTRGDTSTTDTFYWKILGGAVHSVDASDFAGGVFPTGSVTFNAGQSSASFSINVAGDTLVEGNESLLAMVTSSAAARWPWPRRWPRSPTTTWPAAAMTSSPAPPARTTCRAWAATTRCSATPAPTSRAATAMTC